MIAPLRSSPNSIYYKSRVESPVTVDSTSSNTLPYLGWYSLPERIITLDPVWLYLTRRHLSSRSIILSGYHFIFDSVTFPPRRPTWVISCSPNEKAIRLVLLLGDRTSW